MRGFRPEMQAQVTAMALVSWKCLNTGTSGCHLPIPGDGGDTRAQDRNPQYLDKWWSPPHLDMISGQGDTDGWDFGTLDLWSTWTCPGVSEHECSFKPLYSFISSISGLPVTHNLIFTSAYLHEVALGSPLPLSSHVSLYHPYQHRGHGAEGGREEWGKRGRKGGREEWRMEGGREEERERKELYIQQQLFSLGRQTSREQET